MFSKIAHFWTICYPSQSSPCWFDLFRLNKDMCNLDMWEVFSGAKSNSKPPFFSRLWPKNALFKTVMYKHSELVKMAWWVPSLNGRHGHKKGRNSKIFVPITKPMTRRACWALKEFKNLIWGPSYGRFKKSCDKKWVFFRVPSFKRPLRPQILTKSQNFKYSKYLVTADYFSDWPGTERQQESCEFLTIRFLI